MNVLAKDFQYFLRIAEAGSLQEAAFGAGLTHAAMSLSLKRLEAELSVKLFERGRRGALLTEAGRRLQGELSKLENSGRRAVGRALRAEGRTAALRIGSVHHFGIKYLTAVIPKSQVVHLYYGYSLRVYELVREGSLDFGFVSWTQKPNGVECRFLRRDPVRIVGLKSRYRHIEKAKSLEDLKKENWIYHPKPQYDPTRFFKNNRTTYIVGHAEPFTRLILEGHGIGPAQIDQFSEGELRRLALAPVVPPKPKVNLFVIWQKGETAEIKEARERLLKAMKFRLP